LDAGYPVCLVRIARRFTPPANRRWIVFGGAESVAAAKMDATLFLHSFSKRPALRGGLLFDSLVLPRWSAEAINHLLRCDSVENALVGRCPKGKGREDGEAKSRMLFRR
jgi:hypothetical protein